MSQTDNSKGTVLIVRNAYTWQYGGAEQFTLNMAMSLRQLGYRPVVATRVPELLAKCRANNIPVYKNLWLRNIAKKPFVLIYMLAWPFLVAQYVWIMRKYKVKAALLTSRDDQIFGTIAAHWLGARTIWIDHADMKNILGGKHIRWLYCRIMQMSNRVVVVSRAEQAKIFALLPKQLTQKFVLISNGGLRHNSKPASRPANADIVLYVGRVEAEKGSLDLIVAAKSVIELYPKTQFWFVGKGRAEPEILSFIEQHKLDDQIKLLGYQDDIGPFLAASDLFVYPTHHDASPLAPVEALLAGLPVIASDVGGVPELINASCGMLVKPGSPDELAKAISTFLSDKTLRDRLKAGAIKHGRQFEFNHVVKEHYLPLLASDKSNQ